MKKVYIVLTIIVFVIFGVLFYFNSKTNVYSNSLLKYEVTIPSGWHISEIMSKKMDQAVYVFKLANSIGCDISNIVEQERDISVSTQIFQDCMKNSPDIYKIELQNDNFLNNWKIESAHNVYITKFKSDEEINFVLTDLSLPGERLQAGSFIVIRPFDSTLSFSEATSSNKTGLVRRLYSLADNTKVYLYDWRNTKIPQSGIQLSVPITTKEEVLSTNGVVIKSLNLFSTATANSQSEEDFYSLINSLKIN